MAQGVCLGCTAVTAVDVPRCPQCESTEIVEQGGPEHMAKISRVGGPSVEAGLSETGEPLNVPAQERGMFADPHRAAERMTPVADEGLGDGDRREDQERDADGTQVPDADDGDHDDDDADEEYDPGQYTVGEVNAYIEQARAEGNHDEATRVLQAERDGRNRSGIRG